MTPKQGSCRISKFYPFSLGFLVAHIQRIYIPPLPGIGGSFWGMPHGFNKINVFFGPVTISTRFLFYKHHLLAPQASNLSIFPKSHDFSSKNFLKSYTLWTRNYSSLGIFRCWIFTSDNYSQMPNKRRHPHLLEFFKKVFETLFGQDKMYSYRLGWVPSRQITS